MTADYSFSDSSELSVRAERKLAFRTAAELTESAEAYTPWIVKPFVAAGAITEIIGKPKQAGKTTLLAHMVRAILNGAPFMCEPTLQTEVIYLTEESVATFSQALRRVGIKDENRLRIVTWRETISMGWPEVIEEVLLECRRRGAQFVIVDTLSQFANLTGDSENKAGDVLRSLNPLRLLTAANIGVVVVRHERKGGGEVADAGRGSSAFTGGVDIVLTLRRLEGRSRETVREIKALSRYDETPDSVVIELLDGEFCRIDENRVRVQTSAKLDVLDAIPMHEADAIDLNHLMINIGLGRTAVQRAIESLAQEGRIQRTGSGVRGDAIRYFRLCSAQTVGAGVQEEQDVSQLSEEDQLFSAPVRNPVPLF